MMHIPHRDVPSEQKYFFNRHAARLSPAAFGPTASYDVRDHGYIILLCQMPMTLPDTNSPGDCTGSCFHYSGDFCVSGGREIPDPVTLSEILHDLLNFEISINTIRPVLVDDDHRRYHSQVTISRDHEITDAGVVVKFLYSFRVAEEAVFHYTMELAAMIEDASQKLVELGNVKRAAADAADQVIAAAANPETKH